MAQPGVMLSRELQMTLQLAAHEAASRRHEYICLEHLLYAMLHDATTGEILRNCGADLEELRKRLVEFLDRSIERMPGRGRTTPEYTVGVLRVLQRAALHVQSAGRQEVNGGNVLVAMFHETDSHALYFLNEQSVTRFDVVNYISHGVSKVEAEREAPAREQDEAESGDEEAPRLSPSRALKAYAVDLTERAAKGGIDPLIGRENELKRAIHVLLRRRKNNPIFVGEAGVGKTALAEGLALKIHRGEVPAPLKGVELYALDMGALLAGTRFRGDFEQRLKSVIKSVAGNSKRILFIDEIHTLVGAGAASGGSMDASNLLKPTLASGELRCIGSTTYQEYRRSFERDKALARRFQRIDVAEPSRAEAVQILRGLKTAYEKHHGVRYTDEALETAVVLSARYINDRYLPDKAIDVIDEAGVEAHLRAQDGEPPSVGPREVERVVSLIAKIPEPTVSTSDRERLRRLGPELKRAVFGQDHAIDALVQAIKLSRSGLSHPDRPVGAFLFAGPTGVGKTEVARQLARVMGVEFVRFDMSEYMERHTASRLIGAPPGYVGFDQGGLLTDAINRTPHCVLLLDEIEKAHQDVFNLLLQVMDHASLTDNNGRKADFRNVTLVMTTNAGAQELARSLIGFGKELTRGDPKATLERLFSPEFRNRLTAVIEFGALTKPIIERVADKFIAELAERLVTQKVELTVTSRARDYLVEKGFDERFGARPLGRLIENELARVLADELLFGRLAEGGKVVVDSPVDGLEFSYSDAQAATEAAGEPP
jgi:ATP-dependent Clp protease ATP-binding subunit ClpA